MGRTLLVFVSIVCASRVAAGPIAGDSITGGPDLQYCDLAMLLPDDGAVGEQFGGSVSVSGNVALVGAAFADDSGTNSGSAYVFRWDGTAWIKEQKLLAKDGAEGDLFGISVSLSGNVALVGARDGDSSGTNSGSAYVFRWNGTAWVQEQKLLADDGAVRDEFGGSVSVSGDVALVGAALDDDRGFNSGSAYVFRWDGTAWVQEDKLLAENGVAGDRFGNSVSLSGDVALVGAAIAGDNGSQSGSAYVFRWKGTGWVPEQELLADDGAAADRFGSSVSVSGDVALVGAPFSDGNSENLGSAYVFRWNGTAWVPEQELLADDGAAHDFLGNAVSVSGDVALVGADGHDSDSGSAYVFRWNGTAWVQEPKLLPDDGEARDRFGDSVSVSGDMAVVGARGRLDSGSASVFSSSGSDCNKNGVPDRCDIASGTSRDFDADGIPDICIDFCQLPPLLPDDGAPFERFGNSVSVSGDVALVGATDEDFGGSGPAYVFRWTGATWVQEQKLLPDDEEANDLFGSAVSVFGDVALVGAPGDDDNGPFSGSAYVFRWNGTAWVLEQKLLAGDGRASDYFGRSVSLSGDVALVGAFFHDDNGPGSGSAYVFRWNGADWVQEQKLLAGDGRASDHFGGSVSLSGDVALVGAFLHDDNGPGSGSAYVFRWNGAAWVQEHKLLAENGVAGDRFGSSVSLSGDVALVGACSGSAYVYRWNGTAWVQEQKLVAGDGAAIGFSVSVFGDVALAGAPVVEFGSAYLFRWDGITWVQEQQLRDMDATPADEFGNTVSVSGDVALVGGVRKEFFSPGFVGVFSIGVTDCNQNDVFDACDIGAGTSGDCEFSVRGVPDECEVPQIGNVVSKWIAPKPGDWNDAINWCPPEVPDNNTEATFEAIIDGDNADVTLDISPTLDGLTVRNEAVLEVNTDSGAPVRSIFVAEPPCKNPPCPEPPPIFNTGGTIRARDGIRLILDAADIDQTGGGELCADGANSRLEINGRTVIEGSVIALNDGRIELTGSGELLNVHVEGDVVSDNVLVPEGDTGVLAGTIMNEGIIAVGSADAASASYLVPDENGTVLSSGKKTGCVVLKSRLSRLGEFKGSFTNGPGHTIEGAGRIFGVFTNEENANVIANHPTDALIIMPPGEKINSGTLQAIGDGVLDINEPVTQTLSGIIEAVDGGLVLVNADVLKDGTGAGSLRALGGRVIIDSVSASFASMTIDGPVGEVRVNGDAQLTISGPLLIEDSGTYRAVPCPSPPCMLDRVSASLTAREVSAVGSCPAVELSGMMSISTTGDFEIGRSLSFHAVAGGCDPPDWPGAKTADASQLQIGGDFRINESAIIEFASSEPVLLAGSFVNQSTRPDLFDWMSGSLTMGPTDSVANPKASSFEVAGRDLGPTLAGFCDNFAIRQIEIASNSEVTFANIHENAAGLGACDEALYVQHLILRIGAAVTLDNCRIYYETLVDEGAKLNTIGECSRLEPLSTLGDVDQNGVIDLEDWSALAPSKDPNGGCLNGPDNQYAPWCGVFDFDHDLDVDLYDVASFQIAFTGRRMCKTR